MTYNDVYRITSKGSIFLGSVGNIAFDDCHRVKIYSPKSFTNSKFSYVFVNIYKYDYIGSNDLLTYINEL